MCDAPAAMATSPFEAADRAARVWAPLLLLSAIAWLAVIRDEGAAAGLMGLTAAGYAGAWVVMTAAMMLPSLAWFGSVYVRGIKRDATGIVGTARTLSLAAGYLVVWSATAIGALTLAWSFDRLLENNSGALPWVGGAVLVGAGAYQLSPTKRRCLARCRSPLSFALAASRHAGRFRDFKVGLEHGAWCVACCWALMAALVAVGAMSIAWMAVIAAVVLLERSWRHGEALARAVGVALVLVGVLAPFLDWLVPALHGTGMTMGQM